MAMGNLLACYRRSEGRTRISILTIFAAFAQAFVRYRHIPIGAIQYIYAFGPTDRKLFQEPFLRYMCG